MTGSKTTHGGDLITEVKAFAKRKAKAEVVHTYKVSVMGPSLDKHHIQSVQASTPGEALDMVLRASGASDCTQYGVLLIASNVSTDGAA